MEQDVNVSLYLPLSLLSMNKFKNIYIWIEGQIKCFPDKVNLKEFIITKPLLYEMLKGLTYLRKIRSKIQTVKWQQTPNYQQPNLKIQKQKLTKQTTRTGKDSQKSKSHGGLLVGEWKGDEWGKV